ncbi:hypothetical protein BH10ACT3_BH10ACT3_04230 [soil metagenome]
MTSYNEQDLVAEATTSIGGSDPVLAAGVFGLQDLLGAAMVGSAAGGVAGGAAGGGAGNVAGAVLGGIAAKRAYAESQGTTLQLILAVTSGQIFVLNRDSDGRLPDVVATFDRATCEVTITKMGLSRIVHLKDTTSGETLVLTGTTMPLSQLAKGDKVVFQLLSD